MIYAITHHDMNHFKLGNILKLLHHEVFCIGHDHSHELEEIGNKIAEKCKGLSLTILVIGGYISKMDRTLEAWKDVS